MVEHKHGIGSVLSFGAKSVSSAILEKLLIGREKLVNTLEKKVNNIAKDGLNHQVLLIGARGTGKTHMLSVLYNRALPLVNDNKIKIAYFAEEEYGISGYLDFLVRILNAFIRWNENDAAFLKEKLSILQETPFSNQEDTAERIIREYIGEQPLLILAENFNEILSFLKKEGQSKLRNWIQDNSRISIIATSQALSEDIGKEDKPFYGFFEEIYIKPLTLAQSFELLKSLAILEKQDDVVLHLDGKGKSQVKAVHSLVKGNHRLLITFYSFLKSDTLSNLSVMFIKTLNDLKPYYGTYIRYQPPQQQKIIRFLALAKKPQKGVDIARECFIDQKSLSKQLSELSKKKIVDILPNPNDRRNKLYDISEPLLRISIEIGEHREGISALFIDFLALYYDKDELLYQKNKFLNFYNTSKSPKDKLDYNYEFLARERAIIIQEDLTSKDLFNLLRKEEYDLVEKILIEKKDSIKEGDCSYFKARINMGKGFLIKAKEDLLNAIQYDEKASVYWLDLGGVLKELKEYNEAIRSYNQFLKLEPDLFFDHAYKQLAKLYSLKKEFKKAKLYIDKALKISPKKVELLLIKGNLYNELEHFDKSQETFNNVLKLDKNNEEALFGLAINYISKKELDLAQGVLEDLVEISPLEFEYNFLLTIIYSLKKGEKEIDFLYKTLDCEIDDHESLRKILINIMRKDLNFTKEKYSSIIDSVDNFDGKKELKVTLQFLEVFKEIILFNNEGALYELPKEQRLFFQQEILDFREEQKAIK